MKIFIFYGAIFFLVCLGCTNTYPIVLSELRATYRDGQKPAGIAGQSQGKYAENPAYDRYLAYNEIKKNILQQDSSTVAFIKELLCDRDNDLCILGCIAAGKIRHDSFVEPLVVLLSDKNLDVSSHAASALIAINKENLHVTEQVLAKLRRLPKATSGIENLEWGKTRCIYILRKLNMKKSTGDIIAALSDSSQRVRLSAVNALTEMRAKEAIPHILPLFRNTEENPSVRFRSAVALGELDATEAADDLAAALKDDTENVRWGAAMAFKKIKTPKAVAALIETITDKSQKVSAEAIRALYFQTDQKLTADFLRKDTDRQKAQEKWRTWWEQNKDKFK